ncbi:vRNAP protein [Roseobacter phage RD-1410Ws-07]|uniref:VRNAP protein n=1 Tax=Roseobacter phage RD-1410Ws-07 TaxID=1815985 RepID=A0A191VYS7_9CAUD|nr:vRNAP protein [Roseobacter phage RD-1410Ws-07]
MVDTPRTPSPDDIIAESLRDTVTQDIAAVAEDRGNDLAQTELHTDLREMSQLELAAKYGNEVAMNRHRLMDGRDRLQQSDNAEQGFGERALDIAKSASIGAYRDIGSIGIIADSYARAWWNDEGLDGGRRRSAELLAAHGDIVAGMQEQNLSQELQDRRYFEAIEGELDRADSQAQYERDLAEGDSPLFAGLAHQGRDALNAVERFTRDPSLAGNIIAESIGSMVFTAPLGGASGAVAKGMTARMTQNALAQRVAQATAISAATGAPEVTNLYSETVQDVMGVPIEVLSETSPVFQAIMDENPDMTPEEARVQLAGITAETAAVRQIAPTIAFGYVTNRFEALGPAAFRGNSIAQNLLQVAGEGVEEALQGGSATVNRNVAVEEMANIGRATFEGVGEEAAIGALAGMGTAAALGSPRMAVQTGTATGRVIANQARNAADALFTETQFNDPLRQDIVGTASPAQRATQAASDLAGNVTTQARNLASTVAQSPAVAYATDFVSRENNNDATQASQDALDANETIISLVDEGNLDDQVVANLSTVDTPSEGFAGLEGNNVVETVAGITAKMSERGFRPSDEDTAFAATQINRLRQVAESLPVGAKRRIGKILSSKTATKILADAEKLDLNTNTPTGPVTPQEVSTTVNVAKTNPANVDPDRTDQLLEESGENISEQDLKITRAASNVSRAINGNLDSRIEIERSNGVTLSREGEATGKGESVQQTSRSILAAGFKTRSGKTLPSVNDMAANIITGLQSPTGEFTDREGNKTTVQREVKRLRNFVQHMNNRIEALNESFDNNFVNPKTGQLSGPTVKFSGLANGERFYDKDSPDNYFAPVRYSRGAPGSVAFAQQVENDTRTAETVLASIQKEFPEIFEGLSEVVPVTLRKENDSPTAIEGEANARAEETIQTENPRNDIDSSVETNPSETIDEETAPAVSEEGQNTDVTDDGITREDPPMEINGDDIISDENGDPITFYHGTNAVFSEFRDGGIFLTTRKGLAREFARGDGTGTPRLISMNVRLANPLSEQVPDGMDPQDFWLANALTLEQRKAEGRYDGILLFNENEGMIIAESNDQIIQLDTDVDGTLSDEERSQTIEGSDGAVESDEGATATEEGSTETEESELDATLPWNDFVDQMTDAEKARMRETLKARRDNARNQMKLVFGPLASAVRVLNVMPARANDLGRAVFDTREVRMREDLFDENQELTAQGRAVLVHEVGHIVDNHRNPDGDMPVSSARTFFKGGKVFNEMNALRGNLSNYFNGRLEYAFTRGTPEQISSELFAVATEMAFTTEVIEGDLSETAAVLEHVYGDLIGTEATGTATEVSETEVQQPDTDGDTGGDVDGDTTPAEDAGSEVESGDYRVNPTFFSFFKAKDTEAHPKNLGEFLTVTEGSPLNSQTKEFVKSLRPVIAESLSARLDKKVKDGGVTKTIRQHILDGRTQFRRFKAGLLVDPETGEFSDRVIDMAAVAMADWLLTNTGSDPNRLEETLEKLGVSVNDINDGDFNSILNGVPPNQAADGLAFDLMRLLDIEEDPESAVDDLEGTMQGFAKELFTALSENTDLVSVEKVTTTREEGDRDIFTIIVNNGEMREIRDATRAENGPGKKLTAKEVLFGDSSPIYAVGEKLTSVARTQDRTRVQLSDVERKALQKMQDTPNYVDAAAATVFSGIENLRRLFGYDETVDNNPNPVLQRSIRGKNLSIEMNIAETQALLSAAGNPSNRMPVYFPYGITKVGRHQAQGPNPQSNKVMRAVVAPTWSTVDVTDLDNFWIAVGQASDIGGINKAEKLSHADIIANASEKFYAKFGDAVPHIKNLIRSGEVDQDALFETTGVIEPQQLKAIIAVAQLEMAVEDGASTFDTSLSFELDGLTNGVANMMVNFGQGELTPEDYSNFQKVGFFIGKMGETVNKYYAKAGSLDMYETVSRLGDKMLGNMKGLEPWQQEQRGAAVRLAATIGNFDIDEESGVITMSRNSSKNPMTKVNYGSGVRGVAVGVADDMMLKFYEEMQKRPPEVPVDEYFYPGFKKDMETMGLIIDDKPSRSKVFDKESIKKFRTRIQYTIGDTLTEATQQVIGEKINEFNDLMVFSTNVQSQYLRDIYEIRLNELAERLENEGIIKSKKNLSQIPRKYFRELERELGQMAPLFVSDDQTLAIGGFQKGRGLIRTSSNFDEQINDFAYMRLPDDVGVRSIPFSVIGSGDAMMMNYIFGTEGAPDDVLGIFDGLDIPLSKIQDYAPRVNQAVSQTWQRDVMSMAVENFRGFINSDVDAEILSQAYQKVMDKNKKSSVTASNVADLMVQLDQRLAANKARKAVFKTVAASVDQMGGSDVGYTREGREVGFTELNVLIAREMEGKPAEVQEDVRAEVFETKADAFLKSLRFTAKQKQVLDIIMPGLSDETRVVLGTVDQIRDWQTQNNPDNGAIMTDANGAYDHVNDIVYLTTDKPETVLHEMVHAATFKRVENHYNGDRQAAVTRMESLMRDFLKIEDGGQTVRDAQATILRHVNQTDPTRQAMAVNEFMAYVLANSQVRRKAEKTTPLQAIGEKLIALMRRLMGGVSRDMFTQTAFNTKIIIDPPLDDVTGGGGNGDGGSGDGGDLTPMSNNYTNYWIEKLAGYIDGLGDDATGTRRRRDTAQDILNADAVIDSLRQAGMLRNPEDRQTFRAIYGIMKSEMNLDPNSLIALTKVFQHVEENMTPEMFGSGSEAGNEYSAVINSFGSFKRGDTSDAVAVMFALQQTSQKFRDVVAQIPEPETQQVTGTLNSYLHRGTQIFMSKLMGSIQDGAPQEVLDGLKQTLIEANNEKEYAVLRGVTKTLDAADNLISDRFEKAAVGMRAIDAQVKAEQEGSMKQYLTSSVTFITNFLDDTGTALTGQAAQRAAHAGIPILSMVPVRELVDEFVGTNKDNEEVVAMMDVVNAKVTGMRQGYREQLPGIFNRQFREAPVPEQWASMQRTLGNTDFTRYVDVNNLQPSLQMLEEGAARRRQISILENQLQGVLSPSNFNDMKEKAQQLADFMNKKSVGKLLVRNAYAIAKNLEGDVSDQAVEWIDELITMYAIDTMDADVREITVQLWQNDADGIRPMIAYMQYLNQQEDAKAVGEAARLNGYKGYLPNVGRENHRIVVAEDSMEEDMLHRGYKKVAPFTGDVNNAFPRSYYVTNISQQGAYSQGVMQNVSSTYRGVDVNTGLTVTGDAVGFISGEDVVNQVAEELVLDSYELEDPNETLMPVFDGEGAIVGFERSVNPVLSEALLGRDENLATNLGAWAGRQVEESLAYEYNRALVDKLDEMWQNRETGTDDQFVNLKTTTDPIYKESFKLIPHEIKSYMDSKFDGQGPMIMESMVNLSVGYREASVADLWTGKTRMPKELVKTVQAVTRQQFGQKSLRTLMVQAEQGFQGIVSDAKDIIVVKSLVVPVANTQANIIQLSTNGVPNKKIVQGYRKKLAEITEFNKNDVKLKELENQRRMTQDPRRQRLIDDKIQVINDLNAKMSIAPMIAAGAYKQLSEGITDLDRAQTNGGLADWLESKADQLPDTLGNIAKIGMVSKSTDLYRAANRATQYGDFLAKSIYYDHLLDQGLDPVAAIRVMNEEFVNFSALPGRTRSMLERNGLSWFMAFKIRIAKIAAKQMRNNPFRAMALNSITDTGSPIQDNIFTVIGEGRMDYATGYEMLWGAPELNPWVNLMSD